MNSHGKNLGASSPVILSNYLKKKGELGVSQPVISSNLSFKKKNMENLEFLNSYILQCIFKENKEWWDGYGSYSQQKERAPGWAGWRTPKAFQGSRGALRPARCRPGQIREQVWAERVQGFHIWGFPKMRLPRNHPDF